MQTLKRHQNRLSETRTFTKLFFTAVVLTPHTPVMLGCASISFTAVMLN